MLALKGVYDNGKLILHEKVQVSHPVEVIVTFLEEEAVTTYDHRKIALNSFSFAKSREILKGFTGSLSEAVIEERRNEV